MSELRGEVVDSRNHAVEPVSVFRLDEVDDVVAVRIEHDKRDGDADRDAGRVHIQRDLVRRVEDEPDLANDIKQRAEHHGLPSAETFVDRADKEAHNKRYREIHGLNTGCRRRRTEHIGRVIGQTCQKKQVRAPVQDDVECVAHERVTVQKHAHDFFERYALLTILRLMDALFRRKVVNRRADDADDAHHGSRQDKAASRAVREIAGLVHRAEQFEERQTGQRADRRSETGADVAVNIEAPPVFIAIRRHRAHAVVRYTAERVKRFKNEINNERDGDFNDFRALKCRKEQNNGKRPRHSRQNIGPNPLAALESLIERGVADQRIIDRVPDRADRKDRSRKTDADPQHIGQEEHVIEALKLIDNIVGCRKSRESDLFFHEHLRSHRRVMFHAHTFPSSASAISARRSLRSPLN